MGAPDNLGYKPDLVVSQTGNKTEKLLDVTVETNPADSLCDSRIRVTSRPLQIIYNAVRPNDIGSVICVPLLNC